MEQISIRMLNQQTAQVLQRVEAGESVEITSRGRPVARIVPATVDSMHDLVAAGLVLPPTIEGPMPMPTVAADPGSEAGELMSSLRDEERW